MSKLQLEIRGLIAFALFLVPAGIAAFSFIYLPKCKWYTKKIGYIYFGVLWIILMAGLAIDFFYLLPSMYKSV
ncbi:hypothetical protein [Lachnobacterium bovis]|uniref:hypothetical protein n=1 Tax=Lachnobacterium bovis TaxID=140626 RepID=UPI00048A065A|nr:hypothetical protein [Lachnobacterium bovis]